jgi:hypothetical protein
MQALKFEIAPAVFWFSIKRHPPPSDFFNYRFRIVRGGAIIYYLNLHVIGSLILRQDAFQRLLKMTGGIKIRNHYRPFWTGTRWRNWKNYGRMKHT